MELRSSVLVITDADAKAATHIDVTRSQLADFVRGTGTPARTGAELMAELDGVLDRSQLMLAEAMKPQVLDDKGDLDYPHGLEH